MLNGAQSRLMRPGLIAMFRAPRLQRRLCPAGRARILSADGLRRQLNALPTRGISAPDSEFAEDLAIRYADIHHGLRTPHFVSGEAYDAARDRCLETLFEEIAKTHGVATGAVSNSLDVIAPESTWQ